MLVPEIKAAKKMKSLMNRISSLLVIAWALAGCAPTAPLEKKIAAHNPIDLALWRTDMKRRLTVEQDHDLDTALQEMRLRFIADNPAIRSEDVDEQLNERINGHPIREVLLIGLHSKVRRLEVLQAELQKVIADNSKLTTKPGDTASATVLQEIRQDQSTDYEKVVSDIATTKQKIEIYSSSPKTDQTSRAN